MLTRRGFVGGLGALFVAAPAIVRASSLDVIRGVPLRQRQWRMAEVGLGYTVEELDGQAIELFNQYRQRALLIMKEGMATKLYTTLGHPYAEAKSCLS